VTTTPSAEVGKKIRAAMAYAGISQTELAKHLGTNQASVSARLRGRTPFNINELTAIAQHLNMPLSDLMPSEVVAA